MVLIAEFSSWRGKMETESDSESKLIGFRFQPSGCRFWTNSEINEELKGGYIQSKISLGNYNSIYAAYDSSMSGDWEREHCNLLNDTSSSKSVYFDAHFSVQKCFLEQICIQV